ncbi:hypothetical protein [Bacillus timonensis]|uniref:hypothetical protein n=1 Tax=Bacillus timonensis TaxID=1033734 RepID=UPI000287A36A|nr:hypothetical protein [Bacillus timonensis]
MNITRQQLLQKLKENDGIGFVEIDGILHEIRLLQDNLIAFSGACWRWEQAKIPSAHGDYQVVTDVLIEEDPIIPRFPTQDSYEFYPSVNDYS